MVSQDETITVRVTAKLKSEINQIAEAERRRPADLVRLVLEDAVLSRRSKSTKR